MSSLSLVERATMVFTLDAHMMGHVHDAGNIEWTVEAQVFTQFPFCSESNLFCELHITGSAITEKKERTKTTCGNTVWGPEEGESKRTRGIIWQEVDPSLYLLSATLSRLSMGTKAPSHPPSEQLTTKDDRNEDTQCNACLGRL